MVSIPFGRQQAVGIVVEIVGSAEVAELKSIDTILHGQLLDPQQMSLMRWCWRYYQHSPGEVLAAAIPSQLRTSSPYQQKTESTYSLSSVGQSLCGDDFARAPNQRRIWEALKNADMSAQQLRGLVPGWSSVCKRMLDNGWLVLEKRSLPKRIPTYASNEVQLSHEQQSVTEKLCEELGHYHCVLLDGVTGSGKTEVYASVMHKVLKSDQQVLLLVPEIGLVAQLVQRMQHQFGDSVMTFHSGMSNQQRAEVWLAAKQARASIFIGTRSAIFLPLTKPGLIIVDEEHDPGYKQFEGFHYSARDVAIKRAQILGALIILGTATPSLESLANVQQQRFGLVKLKQRYADVPLPDWHLLDCRANSGLHTINDEDPLHGLLHTQAQQAITDVLAVGQQVLVFHNRRGYAPLLQCDACGWQADCVRCSAHMTWHRRKHRLQCHHCEYVSSPPRICPSCASPSLEHFGAGTEQLEQRLSSGFPGADVFRVDSDSMRSKKAMQQLREQVLTGEPCILVGTQMLTKGHHFPNITLVVVLDVDQALFSADFRAPERLAQQLVQVAGRAGRGQYMGKVLLQTRQPDHPLLQLLISADYSSVARELLQLRSQAEFPPFSAQVIVRAEAMSIDQAEGFLRKAKQIAKQLQLPGEFLGPVPALLERRSGRYRYQLWWQVSTRVQLQKCLPTWVSELEHLPRNRQLRWHIDVDPIEH